MISTISHALASAAALGLFITAIAMWSVALS